MKREEFCATQNSYWVEPCGKLGGKKTFADTSFPADVKTIVTPNILRCFIILLWILCPTYLFSATSSKMRSQIPNLASHYHPKVSKRKTLNKCPYNNANIFMTHCWPFKRELKNNFSWDASTDANKSLAGRYRYHRKHFIVALLFRFWHRLEHMNVDQKSKHFKTCFHDTLDSTAMFCEHNNAAHSAPCARLLIWTLLRAHAVPCKRGLICPFHCSKKGAAAGSRRQRQS